MGHQGTTSREKGTTLGKQKNGSYATSIPLAKPKAPDDKEKEKQEKEDTTGEGKP